MFSRTSILAATLPAILLAGCSSGYRGMESQHQPVVSRQSYMLDLTTGGSGLAPSEVQRLAGWMSSLRLGYGDHVYVYDPAGDSAVAREQVAAQAAQYGLLLSGAAPVPPGAVTPGTVRVIVTRMHAAVPGCPDWSGSGQPNFNGHTSTDFGCAVNQNLAAMVAQPEDLVRGQPGTGVSDPDTAAKAIDTLRDAKPTGANGLKTESTSSGGSQ
ncbi:hypothetical protein GCM10023219_08040 [Stakelama sediminis]|uniref:Pilus assembly protein CpaD n=1 Tax=Stakelama sediminis TaxID=463200 RepID=A0A840YVF0_9SPHN|nr:CpaD family pilus assembly protein [Stakelama sediminis]MBB5717525.1 pilus assembly protein CpaD [Stakelama sediminis]